jgi:hypothetical protein
MDRPLFLGEMGQLAVICWDRQASQIIGHFSPRQIRWFRDHVGAFRDAVSLDRDWRDLEHYLIETIDIMEITQEYDQHLPATIPQSKDVPAWSVVRPKISRIFSEHMLADADLVLGSLPATGGVVVLPDARHVWAWIWALYECGMHLAFRLGLPWVPPHTEISSAADRAARSFPKVMAWLMTVIDTLVDVADLPYPAIADNCRHRRSPARP